MQKPRNPNLYEALRAYVVDALSVVRSHDWGPNGLPTHSVPRVKIEQNSMSSRWEVEFDYSYAILSREKELQRLDSYSAVAHSMRSDPMVARHLDTMLGDGGAMFRVTTDTCLRDVLLHLMIRQKNVEIDMGKFHELYDEFEAYFYDDLLRRRGLSPLSDFEMKVDQIELGDGFLLRRLSTLEREEIASRWAAFMQYPTAFVVGSWPTGWEEFALDVTVQVNKVIGQRPPRALPGGAHEIISERFEAALSALRLFRAGGVDLTSISVRPIGWDVIRGGGFSISRGRSGLGPRYVLSKEEVPAFTQFWAYFQKQRTKKRNRIDLATRRFNLAYDRLLPEDRLIDYVIALEALLMRDEQQELSFRLALRGCVLLGLDEDSRSQIYSRLRAAYGIRSHVVHGGEPPAEVPVGLDRIPFGLFVDAVAEDVRAAIRKMLELTETAGETQVIAALDERLVRGVGLPPH